MEVSCSFKSIVGSFCSYDRRDRKKSTELVPLVTCQKDISSHQSAWSFSGVESERELILMRARIFSANARDTGDLSIFYFHRSELGIGWRRSSSACQVPPEIARHTTKTNKGDRGVGKDVSELIFQKTGVLVPVGSGKILV